MALTYKEIGSIIGALVDQKNKAYGNSFWLAGKVLAVMYPDGVPVSKYQDMLYTVRVIDKLFRIATQKNAFGENPAEDIAGYSILMSGQPPDKEINHDQARHGNVLSRVRRYLRFRHGKTILSLLWQFIRHRP